MAFRFRRSLTVIPGVKVNFGKTGASVSVGPRGAKATFGGRGRTRATCGIPGTGLSHTSTAATTTENNEADESGDLGRSDAVPTWLWVTLLGGMLLWLVYAFFYRPDVLMNL